MEQEELWCPIGEFPEYEVSNTGLVINTETNRLMRLSKTQHGALKVGLVGDDGRQHTRSVKVLVATLFVEGHTEIFDTPINLNGDQENNTSENLAWRPRWFAWKYARQYEELPAYYVTKQIYDTDRGDKYDNMVHAAKINGLLLKDILISCYQGNVVFPTGQTFAFVE